MKTVAILQNQWFRDPIAIKRIFDKHPEAREDLVARFLFMGCRTGQIILQVFGKQTCRRIIWEEASREMGDHPSSVFKADQQHIKKVLEKHKPDVVLSFGAVSRTALIKLKEEGTDWELILAPHPVARGPNTFDELRKAQQRFYELECKLSLW